MGRAKRERCEEKSGKGGIPEVALSTITPAWMIAML